MSDSPGTLWIVATPLGNAQDFSPRAHAVLEAAQLVLCEDTRRAARLFASQGITAPRMLSFFDHNEQGRVPQVLEHLARGEQVALVSDAGTPVLSDPGYLLVRACRDAGHPVRPVPGPSAVMAALCASGVAPQPFSFLGFLPRKAGDARTVFERFAPTGCTLVFFERKDRLAQSLSTALEVLGERDCVIARELTKTHEEFIAGDLSALAGRELNLLGEITVVLGPVREKPVSSDEDVERALREELAAGGKPRDVARRVAARVSGLCVKDAYERVLAAREDAHA